MYGTLNIKQENGEGVTYHSVHSVEVVEKGEDFTDLDVHVYVPKEGGPQTVVMEVRLIRGERAFEMNGLAETVAVYYGGLKK